MNRLQNKFSLLFDELLERQLSLKGVMNRDDWKKIKNEIYYHYETDSHFTEMKRNEILQERLNIMRDLSEYAGKYYSNEYIRKNILAMSDDDIRINDEQISKELEDPRFSGEDDMKMGMESNSVSHDKGDFLSEENIEKIVLDKIESTKNDQKLKNTINDILSTINLDN